MSNRNILTYKEFALNEVMVSSPEEAISLISRETNINARNKVIKEIVGEYFSDDLIFGRKQLSLNTSGQDVSVLQTILKSIGYLKNQQINGILDQKTMVAVQSFGKKYGIVVDVNQPIPNEIIKVLIEFDSAEYVEVESKIKIGSTTPSSTSTIVMPQSSVSMGEGVRVGVDFPLQEYADKYKLSIQYSKAKDGDKNVSPTIKVKDFACRDGSDIILINPHLIEVLEKIRAHFNKNLLILSGYRTPPYNRKIGGAGISQHMFGNAADFRIDGVKPIEICTWLNTFHTGGIGLYVTKNFTHVDVRNVIGSSKGTWSKPKGIKF
jgi:uncharacterized protein YcbK (DUF882 family)